MQRIVRLPAFVLCACVVSGCMGPSFIRPNPPVQSQSSLTIKHPSPQAVQPPVNSGDTLDFSEALRALDSSAWPQTENPPAPVPEPMAQEPPRIEAKAAPAANGYSLFHVGRTSVRILLQQGLSKIALVGEKSYGVKATHGFSRTVNGNLTLKSAGPGRLFLAVGWMVLSTVELPCTLIVQGGEALEIGRERFRGDLIVAPDKEAAFSLVNICPVEDYLRGVVPLEIGGFSGAEIEAVKAQAVAARTYAYRKMIEHEKEFYDVQRTVADQVYGGIAVEKSACDNAIAATAGLVLAYNDSLIYAYYHSTCGGATASSSDVWDKPGEPYLTSVRDVDDKGNPYCNGGPASSWSETWSTNYLSYILERYSKEFIPDHPCRGLIHSISVLSRFPCGRVKQCRVVTSRGSFVFGGDKLRSVFRRNEADFPILRSAMFTIESVSRSTVTVSGKGNGHGVGMCQRGALGRARQGQSYAQILKAYYRGISLKKAVP
ncbi:MAG: SpoIID/LytB domain-containing protein [Chitinivibrionales bacterium]|nr:SpoIID/LytB domain-containing protein [Chitinivibrionales bacterium]